MYKCSLPGCANIRKSFHTCQVRIQSQNNNRGVSQDTSNDDQVIHVWRRHLDLPEKYHLHMEKKPYLAITQDVVRLNIPYK